MAEEQKTFKGFPLDQNGNIKGCFPIVEFIQRQQKDLLEKVSKGIYEATIEYCLKFNIDPDVLLKQKAEIELLLMKIEKMKCCGNCKHSEEDNKSSTICDECFELCYWEMKK